MKAITRLALFTFLFSHFTPAMANLQSDINKSCSLEQIHKAYIPLEKLDFSEKGIFIQTGRNEWRPIEQIHHDSQGFYLTITNHLINKQNSEENETWTCPKCYYENTSTNGVCERCLWPLYEWDQ